MALSETVRATILGLSPEERAEARRLLDEAEASASQPEPEWLRKIRHVQEQCAREGVWIDAVAEVRAARDEMG